MCVLFVLALKAKAAGIYRRPFSDYIIYNIYKCRKESKVVCIAFKADYVMTILITIQLST